MQHGILPNCKESSSMIWLLLTSNKIAAYLQILKDVTRNKEKKRRKVTKLSDGRIIIFFNLDIFICLL